MKKGMKDVRGARKAERQYGDEAKRCIVCGRWHTRRDKTCSSACAQKAAQRARIRSAIPHH
jgi:hypothetical protein